MSGKWHCQTNDGQGLFVFNADDCPTLAFDADGHRTEALAWAWGLDCLLARRDELREGIKDARRELKAALRRERIAP